MIASIASGTHRVFVRESTASQNGHLPRYSFSESRLMGIEKKYLLSTK